MEKEILRFSYESNKIEKFVKDGFWANGMFAYSKITLNENGEEEIKNEDEGVYFQRKINGKLVMFHI